jgi:hypothetical protein
MTKANKREQTATITLDPNPKEEIKALAGSDHDDGSLRLVNVLRSALPGEGDVEATLNNLSLAPDGSCAGVILGRSAMSGCGRAPRRRESSVEEDSTRSDPVANERLGWVTGRAGAS